MERGVGSVVATWRGTEGRHLHNERAKGRATYPKPKMKRLLQVEGGSGGGGGGKANDSGIACIGAGGVRGE